MIHICFDFFSHSKISPSERQSAAANFPVSVANSIPYYIIYSMLKLLKIALFTKFSYLFYTVFQKRFCIYKRTITGECFISGIIFSIISCVRIFRLDVLMQGWQPI